MKDSNLTDDKRLDIFYDHYKTIVQRNNQLVQVRYRYLFYLLIVIVLILIRLVFPTDSETLIADLVVANLSLNNSPNLLIIESGLWFLFLLLIVRYFQINISIERNYGHIHELEEKLCNFAQTKVFTFEGETYLNNYPLFLSLVNWIYKWCIPLCILLVIALKIINDHSVNSYPPLLFVFNSVCAFLIFLVICLYWNFTINYKKVSDSSADLQPVEQVAG